jgi:type II secretory pathway pseudopilin PulG
MPHDKRNIKTAFTIVELTVAMVVSALVLAAACELLGTLRSVARKQSRDLLRAAQVTDALELIRDDLMHALAKPDDQQIIFTGGDIKLMQFHAFCPAEFPSDISGIRQICRVEYELQTQNEIGKLYRLVTPIVGPAQSQANGNKKLLCDNIDKALIWFHDGQRLLPSFSSKSHLPTYVKLVLTIHGRIWPLTVGLPCAKPDAEQNQ